MKLSCPRQQTGFYLFSGFLCHNQLPFPWKLVSKLSGIQTLSIGSPNNKIRQTRQQIQKSRNEPCTKQGLLRGEIRECIPYLNTLFLSFRNEKCRFDVPPKRIQCIFICTFRSMHFHDLICDVVLRHFSVFILDDIYIICRPVVKWLYSTLILRVDKRLYH